MHLFPQVLPFITPAAITATGDYFNTLLRQKTVKHIICLMHLQDPSPAL